MTEPQTIQVYARVNKAVYDLILKRQAAAKKLTGIEPSISEVVRAMIEEAAGNRSQRRRT